MTATPLSLADLLHQIRSGSLAPEAALRRAREAIAAREGEVGAFAHLAAEPWAAAAGPLAGIAVGVKDVIDTADMPTGMGSPIYDGWRPLADGPVVAALRRAGATVVGKTTTTAFASSDPTATRNPAAPGHTPGGSSAGSAAAVAAGMVPLALGTQTGGSVIRPASFCGVAAMKPSFRLIPTVGVKCYSWTLDTVGFFAGRVRDLATAFPLVTGRPGPSGGTATRPRIGLVRQGWAGAPEPDAAWALDEAVRLLEEAGAETREVDPPGSLGEAWAAHPTIQDWEAANALGWEYDRHRDRLAPQIRGHLDRGRTIAPETYDAARRLANAARRDSKLLFRDLDAVVTYAAPGAAPAGFGSTGDARYNRLWTLLGTPCVTVPGLLGRSGLPIGIQVVAPFAQDARALDVALLLERCLARPDAA